MIYEAELSGKWAEKGECLAGFGKHVGGLQRCGTGATRGVSLYGLDFFAVQQLMCVIAGYGIGVATAGPGRSSGSMWSSMRPSIAASYAAESQIWLHP
jgi:hypothetical protein